MRCAGRDGAARSRLGRATIAKTCLRFRASNASTKTTSFNAGVAATRRKNLDGKAGFTEKCKMKNKDLVVQLKNRRAETLSSLVAEELERMIIRGELQAGDRINESALAQMFNISRGPIREACRSLEKSNLVRLVTNRGVFVREMSVDQAADIYEIRARLFGLAGRLAASRVSNRDITKLRAMVTGMKEAKDIDVYYPLNVAFHARLVELSGNTRLVDLYGALSKELHLF